MLRLIILEHDNHVLEEELSIMDKIKIAIIGLGMHL